MIDYVPSYNGKKNSKIMNSIFINPLGLVGNTFRKIDVELVSLYKYKMEIKLKHAFMIQISSYLLKA